MSSRRNRPSNLSASMPPQSMSSTSAADAYEEKIRRKMEAANNPTTPPRASSTSVADTSFEAKLKAKLASADNPKSDSLSSSGRSRNSSSISSRRPKHLSASMPPQSMDGDGGKPGAKSSHTESYEDKIKRKMEEADKNASSSKSKQPSIMKTVATAQAMSSFEAKLKIKSEEARSRTKSSKAKSSRPKHLSMSMPPTASASMSDVLAESNHSGDGTSYFDVSSVSFDEVFDELQKFQNLNTNTNSSLTIPTSHSLFNDVIDKLGSLGLEEILKKRWEHQYEALKAYEEENGNILVPCSHPTLGKWVNVQCEQYKLYKERLPCSLSKKRYGKLKDVGFDDYVSWKGVEDNKKKVYGRSDSGHSFDKEKPRRARRITTGDDAYGDKIRQKMGLASSTSSVPIRRTSDGDATTTKKRVPTRRATVDEKKQALDEKIQRKKMANKMKLMENYSIEDDVGGGGNKNNDSDSDDSFNLSNIPKRRPSGMTAIDENPGEMSNVNIESFSELGDILALVSEAEDKKTTHMSGIQE